jgi:predicted acyl esterase
MRDMGRRLGRTALFAFLLSVALASGGALQQTLPKGELREDFKAPVQPSDFDERVVMIPMRDGVKLYTVIVVPKGAQGALIVLTRTPYNAADRAWLNQHNHAN